MDTPIIDNAQLAKLKKAWEKEAKVNHDAEMAYKQGWHDAVEEACEFILESGHVRIGGITRKEFVEYFRKEMEKEYERE